MKAMKYLATALAACMAFASCSTDVEQPRLAPADGDNYPAPTLAGTGDILVNSDNSSENVSFVCSQVDFGLAVPVQYKLYLESGSESVHVATSYAPTITLTKSDINGTVMNSFGAAANTRVQVGAYVIAYAGESDIRTEKSNTVQFSVTTFRAALRQYYLCGVYNGWDAGSAPGMYETAGGSNTYAGMFNLTEDVEWNPGLSGFKVLPVRAWEGDLGYDAFTSRSANITSSSDGNLMVPAGIWQITANIGAMAIDAVAVKDFYVAGSWNGWGNSTKLVYDPATNVWRSEIPIPAGSEFKVVYEAPSQTWLGDTGNVAENMPAGCTDAVELGDGGNFTAPAADKFVVVYADRTPYVMVYE